MNLFKSGLAGLIITALILSGCSKDSGGSGSGVATFTLGGSPGSCTGFTLGGTYTAGTALTSGNTVTLTVNVTKAGTYTISTSTANGISFSKSGTFTATGSQTVTLTGTGTPTAAGASNYTVTAGSNNCTFSITATGGGGGAAVFTTGSAGACASFVPAGTYKAGTALSSGNTVVFSVNVTTPGTYSISTNTANGISFSGSGTFSSTGTKTVTLTGTGTPTAATAATYTVGGGTGSCTFSITPTAATPNSVQISSCDNFVDDITNEWEISGGAPKGLQTSGQKEGTAWLEADWVDGTNYIHFIDRLAKRVPPVTINTGVTPATGQLQFWLYIGDVTQIDSTGADPGQVELTSSGMSDVNEYNWKINEVMRANNLITGWNLVKLDFSSANIATGAPDLTKINFFRIYWYTKTASHPTFQVGLDDIRVGVK